jgi:hypothetical protein
MALYHYTLKENLPSIQKHGLLSWEQLEQRGIRHHSLSNCLSRKLDARQGLENYIRLTHIGDFTLPMLLQRVREGEVAMRDIVRLELPDVYHWQNVLYSDMNATDNDAYIDSNPETFINSTDPQKEVLVLNRILWKWVKSVEKGDDLLDLIF